MKEKRKAVLIRIHPWMYDELKKEAHAQIIPISVNRLIVETLLAKFKRLENSRNLRDLVPRLPEAKK